MGFDDVPAAHDGQTLRFRRGYQVVIELESQRVQGQERYAHAGHDRLLDRFIARHLHHHPRRHLMRAHVLVEGRASARPRLAHDESFVRQRARGHHVHAREAMVDRRDQHVRMHGERLGAGRPPLGRPAHDGQLDIAFLHQCDDLLAIVGDLQPNLDSRMFFAKLRKQPRQEVLGRADHSHIQRPGLQAAETRHQVLGIAHGRQHPPRMGQHVFADHGQRDLAAGSIEER